MTNQQNIITLYDNAKPVDFEFLDLIAYQGQDYVVLWPLEDPDNTGEVVILRVEADPRDKSHESYVSVESNATLNAVFGIFRERFKDVFNFV